VHQGELVTAGNKEGVGEGANAAKTAVWPTRARCGPARAAGALAPELAAFVEGGFPFVHISQLPEGDALPVGRRAFFGLPLPVGFVVTAASAGYFVF